MPIKRQPSTQVEKYRRKLEHSITEEKKLLNIHAIENTKNTIHQWLNAHKNERINLKHKSINVFDENEHSAAPKSKFILNLISQIKANKNISSTRKFKASRIDH